MKTFRILTKLIVAALLAMSSISAFSGTPSQLPLSLKSGVPPNVMFAMSVEYPTATNFAYQDSGSYSRGNTYLGYFDDTKCYSYRGYLTGGAASSTNSVTSANSGWFVPIEYATTQGGAPHACPDNYAQWSGNFLNWVSMTTTDEFRIAMTGGNRVVDLPSNSGSCSPACPNGLTVLEKSWQTSPTDLFNKTWTEDGYTTDYNNGDSLTIVNQGNKNKMVITSGSAIAGTATCNNPTSSGSTVTCSNYTLSNGDTTTCSTYSGDGITTPYTCTAFANSSGGTAITSPTATATASVAVAGISGSAVISCPADNTRTFAQKETVCTATLSDGSTGTCSGWNAGPGSTTANAYTCTGFNTFSNLETFGFTSSGTNATVTDLVAGTQIAYPSSSTYYTCSVSVTGSGSTATATTTCPSTGSFGPNSSVATCTALVSSYSGLGTTSSPKYCTTFTLSNSNDQFISEAYATGSGNTTGSSPNIYSIKYRITAVSSDPATVNYKTTYTGSYNYPSGQSLSYSSTYNVSIGTSRSLYVRVQVCNPTVGLETSVGSNYCQVYGDGTTYKPTGVLQSNGNTMRFGVTSYFNATDIDNAVLRAKAKYLSPNSYLAAGTYTPNAAAEWSATDGTLVGNPDSADSASWWSSITPTPTHSGVINYINKFGSTAASYKSCDNISKLYYETLKYLRGGQGVTGGIGPTTDFYDGATTGNSDGFPVITSWDDPVQYSCQKNYIITMGDANTHSDKRLPGGSFATSSTGCDAGGYTDSNGNVHPVDAGSLTGDYGITGTIKPTTTTSVTINTPSDSGGGGVTDATNAVAKMENFHVGSLATTIAADGEASYYIAGLAAWAATNNIRPDIASSTNPMHVKTFMIDVNEYQHCDYQSQFWLTAKYGDPSYYNFSTAGVATWNSGAAWYNSIGNTSTSSSCNSNGPPNQTGNLWWWPKNLLRAGDPISMISSVKSAIQAIAAEQGDEAALAQSAGTLNTGTGAYIYQAGYNSAAWTGDVQAYILNQSGQIVDISGVVQSSPYQPDWAASHMLPLPSNRNVFTFRRDTNVGTPFAPDSSGTTITTNFDSVEQNYLNSTDALGADRVKYIRGDMSNEAYMPSTLVGNTSPNIANPANHGWRSRLAVGVSCTYPGTYHDGDAYSCPTPATSSSAASYYTTGPTGQLGDIIDSSPLYVAAPSQAYADSSYKTFAVANASRAPMVYVGGNDGLVHGYNAAYTISSTTGLPVATSASGTEVFAYVPYATYPTLNNLMNPTFVHTFYVDGSPVSADVNSGSTWKTILVGGMAAGGKGVYALDVTNPVGSGFTASNVLWEFTNLDDPDLGYTFSQPIIQKLKNGHWAVIFGNGFNSVDSSGNPNNNNAYLFVLYVDPGSGGTPWNLPGPSGTYSSGWVLNTNYFKIALPSPGTPNNASNGLGGVAAIDTDGDGMVDYVYGGDRNGNMWKVDLTGCTNTSCTLASAFSASSQNQPLFSAKDSAGNRQQITTTPKVVNSLNGGYMVLFGTGSWIDTTDPNSPFKTDTLYGIWDQNTGLAASPVTGRSVLQPQALLGDATVLTSTTTSSGITTTTTTTTTLPCVGQCTTTVTSVFDSNGNQTSSTSSTSNTATPPCTLGSTGCTIYMAPSSCAPNYTTTALSSIGNQTDLCPQYIPNPSTASFSPSTVALATPSTPSQYGWYFDLIAFDTGSGSDILGLLNSGERSHSDPPVANGTTVQFTSLMPSTNPCNGNTSGFEYDLSYMNGGAATTGIFVIPGSVQNNAGFVQFVGASGKVYQVAAGGQTLSSGAALNPISFNATPPASVTGSTAAGMPTGTPTGTCAGSTGCATQFPSNGSYPYIPGWGFLMNLNSGGASTSGRWLLSCYPAEIGSGITCGWRHNNQAFGVLSWKQIQ